VSGEAKNIFSKAVLNQFEVLLLLLTLSVDVTVYLTNAPTFTSCKVTYPLPGCDLCLQTVLHICARSPLLQPPGL